MKYVKVLKRIVVKGTTMRRNLLYTTFTDFGRSVDPVPVDVPTPKGNLKNSGRIPSENAS